tara:strand:+ start:25245 stop:25481 length:237 start_codon:yes stop_codon:yes gene_type:complete
LQFAHGHPFPRRQQAPRYDDVVIEVSDYLNERAKAEMDAGIGRSRIMLAPGFGFGTSLNHNVALFGAISRLAALGFPC